MKDFVNKKVPLRKNYERKIFSPKKWYELHDPLNFGGRGPNLSGRAIINPFSFKRETYGLSFNLKCSRAVYFVWTGPSGPILL